MARTRRPSAVYDERYQSIIRRVREARRDAGMTQVEVAKALGRPLSFVSKCELGERRIDPAELEVFANLFGKPIMFFYEPAKSQRRRKHRSSTAE
jgi:transcriptional regulator with XRE-family HTH domain